MKTAQILQTNFLVLNLVRWSCWIKLQNAYFPLHNKACSETTQYCIRLLKCRYLFCLTRKNRPLSKTPFLLSQEKHVQALYSQESGKSTHGEIFHAHSFILISTIEHHIGSALGLKYDF